jgi:S1-C subfamily serine protease
MENTAEKMKALIRSHFASAVLGGLVVAGAFLALGVTGERTRQTIIDQGPIAEPASSSASSALTPHQIYVRDAPGVVFVRAQVVQQVENPFDLFPEQQRSISTGSGFLIDRLGDILTNFHVIAGAEHESGVTVQFEDDISRPATVIGEDQNNDLALLHVDMGGVGGVAPLQLGDSSTIRVGDPTLAIGNPFGLDRTLTSGIVSALQREIQAPDGFAIDNVIQTDVPINPGNSGGPLLDAVGRVIGINSQIVTGSGDGNGSVGIAFAVPINTARELLPRLKRGGEVKLGYLGVRGVPATRSRGVIVRHTDSGSPAASAGLKPGDVIRTVAGRRTTTVGDLEAVVEAQIPGDAAVIRVDRAGQAKSFTVVLGVRPTGTASS